MLSRRASLAVALGALLLVETGARAQDAAARGGGDALTRDTGMLSPHWNYELRAVYFEPDLDLFETFYGDDSTIYPGVSLSYRLSDRLELGGEYGLMKEKGVGLLTETGQPGGSVKYRLDIFHVFAKAIFQHSREQRVVPYVGAGLLTMRYRQEVEFQPDIEGRPDTGWSACAGVRFRVMSHGPEDYRDPSGGSPYWRSYVFLEAQKMSAKADEADLGGDALLLGFRMEFDTK